MSKYVQTNKYRLIKVEYRLFGKIEFSLYDGHLFTIDEALQDLTDLLPAAKILGFSLID